MNEKIINQDSLLDEQDIGVNEQDIQQDIDSNIPTQSTVPLNKMFIPLPSNLMSYSLSENHWVLPVYMYSFTRKSSVNPIEPNMVETTLGLMSEVFCPNEDSRRGIGNKIGEALNILYNGVEGKFSPVISLCDEECHINISTKSSLLRYTVDRVQSRTGFLKLNYDEYFKLENLSREVDEKGKCIYNIVELMNLYVYLKSRASLYCNINEKKYGKYIGINNTKIHDSISTISNELGIGNKTCAMYLNQLEKIGMIKIFRGKEIGYGSKLKNGFGGNSNDKSCFNNSESNFGTSGGNSNASERNFKNSIQDSGLGVTPNTVNAKAITNAKANINAKANTNAKANYYMINYDWRLQ